MVNDVVPISDYEAIVDTKISMLELDETAALSISSETNETTATYKDNGSTLVKREPLRFNFTGYSLWLEVEELDDDLTRTLNMIADENGVIPIPEAHVTAIYGMNHLTEHEVRQRFRTMKSMAKFCESWPDDLRFIGVLMDIELAGVNGGLMDMAWAEITISTSTSHEDHLDSLYDLFFAGHVVNQRIAPWKPHLSLAYDNPENSVLNLGRVVDTVLQSRLLTKSLRRVTGISLWDTNGLLEDWKCMDRLVFESL